MDKSWQDMTNAEKIEERRKSGKVVIYTMSIRNTTTRNKRTIYGHITPNVIDQYWEAYAEHLEEDEELVIERWNSDNPPKLEY